MKTYYNMGEIADSLINGEFDHYTGEYIGEPCGYPRTISGSLPWERNGAKPKNNIRPVMSMIDTKKGCRANDDWKFRVIRAYAVKTCNTGTATAICNAIMKDNQSKGLFKSWLNEIKQSGWVF